MDEDVELEVGKLNKTEEKSIQNFLNESKGEVENAPDTFKSRTAVAQKSDDLDLKQMDKLVEEGWKADLQNQGFSSDEAKKLIEVRKTAHKRK